MFYFGVHMIDFIESTKQTTVKIKIQSTAYISTIEIQQQVLQQVSSAMTLQSLEK